MGVSIDQVPVDLTGTNEQRWVFQLSEPLNGHHGGAFFVDGQTVDPVDGRVFKRFVIGHGHVMVGALRVAGGEFELGDTSALRTAQEPPTQPATKAPSLPPVTHEPILPPARERSERPAAFEADEESKPLHNTLFPKGKAKR